MPITCSGRLVDIASFMIGIDDVFEASTASSDSTTSSRVRNTDVFAFSFSTIASTTRSRSARSPIFELKWSLSSVATSSAGSSLPALTALPKDFSILARPAEAASSEASTTMTSAPALADTSAMPEPIRPAPITPTRSNSTPFSAIRAVGPTGTVSAMTPEDFRAAGHELIDWIADYRARVESFPVKSQVGPGDVRRALPAEPPTATDTIGDLLRDLDEIVVPGTTMVQHPMHFGWFPSNASLSSVLGDIASSGLGGLGISWESCPALTEVEEVMCDWMRQLIGLSDQWYGVITDTASTSTLTGLLVARERATDHIQNGAGCCRRPPRSIVYATDQAHSSVAKAALLAGFGWDNIRLVATDPTTRAMDPAALAEMMAADRQAGLVPAAVVATTGTTATPRWTRSQRSSTRLRHRPPSPSASLGTR